MIRWRGLYIGNLRKRGLTNQQIIDRLRKLYIVKDWGNDPWKMLKRFRKDIIDSGGTPSPGKAPKKGSHHPKSSGWSAGDRKSQKARSKESQRKQAREDLLQKIIRASGQGNRAEKVRLERELNRRFGG
jgi:hypothetical protein